MNDRRNLLNTLKHPSAFLPVAMSIVAVALIAIRLARFGLTPEPDEGASAHLWQLLMALQIPIIAFFAIRWLVRSPGSAGFVLALQAAAGAAAIAPVYFFGW